MNLGGRGILWLYANDYDNASLYTHWMQLTYCTIRYNTQECLLENNNKTFDCDRLRV